MNKQSIDMRYDNIYLHCTCLQNKCLYEVNILLFSTVSMLTLSPL